MEPGAKMEARGWGLERFVGSGQCLRVPDNHGLTISQYPNVFSLITRYFETWGTLGYPVLPGYALGPVIIYFFTVSGIWGLVSAGLRFAFTNFLSRPMRDIVGALFALYVANAFSQLYLGGSQGNLES